MPCVFSKMWYSKHLREIKEEISWIRCARTSSRTDGCGFARLAAADREDAGAGAGADADAEVDADAADLLVTSVFRFSRGLSRESSTVASVGEKQKAKKSVITKW